MKKLLLLFFISSNLFALNRYIPIWECSSQKETDIIYLLVEDLENKGKYFHFLKLEKRRGKRFELVSKLDMISDYDDVNSFLHPIARFSLEAHLIRLIENNQATFDGQKYSLVE